LAYRTGRISSWPMIPAFLLVFLAVAYRIATGLLIHSGATWFSNFAPFAAIALCGAVYFPSKLKLSVPLLALFVSDAVLNYYYSAPLFSPLIACRYLTLALIGCIGLTLQNRASLKTLLPASIAGSTIFYFVTCIFAWLSDPGYARNFGGLIQSLTVGLSQYSSTPSWMFFRNALLSDLVFTFAFVLCMSFSRNPERSRAAFARPT
jgi:hypothetical protein